MRVAYGAIFQNGLRYIDRFVAQWYSLTAFAPEHTFDPILVEGDSTDNDATWDRLNGLFPGHVHRRSHGGSAFGSVDDATRWAQVSYACNGVVEQLGVEHDALLWAEADLIWEPATLVRLLGHLSRVDMVCAMVMMRGLFYDTWAFSQAGVWFQNAPPYHPMLGMPATDGLYPLDSGGSCWAVRGELARKCRFRPPERAMRGFCDEVRAAGGSIWLDAGARVEHPLVGVKQGFMPAGPPATGHASAVAGMRVR